MKNYYDFVTALKDIYLEDSYVLIIDERASEIDFEMEFVLRENHVLYNEPKCDEKYCYRRGILRLSNCVDLKLERNSVVNFDANNEADLGNIDLFIHDGVRIIMSGQWGGLHFGAGDISVFLIM